MNDKTYAPSYRTYQLVRAILEADIGEIHTPYSVVRDAKELFNRGITNKTAQSCLEYMARTQNDVTTLKVQLNNGKIANHFSITGIQKKAKK
jgi:hypothetical protein